jgi:hypothetical protein
VGLEQCRLSHVSTDQELLGRNNSGSGLETENMAVGIHRADQVTTLSSKVGTNFANKLQLFGWYSSRRLRSQSYYYVCDIQEYFGIGEKCLLAGMLLMTGLHFTTCSLILKI